MTCSARVDMEFFTHRSCSAAASGAFIDRMIETKGVGHLLPKSWVQLNRR